MLNAFAEALSSKNDPRPHFLVGIGPERPETLPPHAEWFDSSHPVPDQRSVKAARRALDVAAATTSKDVLVVLLSGGASALMALPGEGITLEDTQQTVRQLLKGGATIDELNAVRKHLSAIKGGRLAAATQAHVVTLAISDVVGDDLSVIGSGPTVPDPSTYADALAVLDRRGGRAAYPAAVVMLLERGARGEIPETPKPDDPRMARSVASIIGGRMTAVEGAADAGRSRGYDVHVIEQPIVGEAREAARTFTEDVRQAAVALKRPACIVGGGETTVVVKGNGLGGRNQEFTLAMMSSGLVFGSIGTDGIDGPTDAAGAVVDPTTADRARARGLDPQRFLDNNDSYHFFSALDDLLRTGPTGTNVGDVQVALIA
jgi:hydroxypyruvate reductase